MDRFVTWLKTQWAEFCVDPIGYGWDNGWRIVEMALGILLILCALQCAGGIVGL